MGKCKIIEKMIKLWVQTASQSVDEMIQFGENNKRFQEIGRCEPQYA